jgi:two-component system, OmpR family, response regulator
MSFGRAKKIFLVDDDEMLATALQDYLTRKVNHSITIYNTGEEALKHLSEQPDIIVLDYYLNTVSKDAMNGMEILQNIKKHSPKTSVIMLSSQERYGIAMQTLQKGAEQYVIKGEDAFEKIAEMVEEIE